MQTKISIVNNNFRKHLYESHITTNIYTKYSCYYALTINIKQHREILDYPAFIYKNNHHRYRHISKVYYLDFRYLKECIKYINSFK